MQDGGKSAHSEARKAMAMARRLSRAGAAVFDRLAQAETGMAPPDKLSGLIAPFQTPDVLMHLLAPKATADSPARGPRAVSPQVSPHVAPAAKRTDAGPRHRTQRDPAALAPVKTGGIKHPPALSDASTPVGTLPAELAADRPRRNDTGGLPNPKPTTLRDIANLRRMQKQPARTEVPARPDTPQSKADLPGRSDESPRDTGHPQRRAGTARDPHPLVALAAKTPRAVTEIAAAPPHADPMADLPAPTTTARTAAASPKTPADRQTPLDAAHNTQKHGRRAAVPPPKAAPRPDAVIPAAPARSTATPSPTKTQAAQSVTPSEPSLSEVAWRNGVEPQ